MHEDCNAELVIDRHFCERSFDIVGFSAHFESDHSTNVYFSAAHDFKATIR
jgi:hypothetical protein